MTDMAGAHDCIVFARMGMSEERLVIIASVSVLRDFSWKVQLHGRDIPLQYLEFDHASCGSVSGVRKLIDFLHTRSTCSGSDDDKFLPLVTARKGKFMDTTGNFTHNFINTSDYLYVAI